MNSRVTLVQEKERPMFSPYIEVTMKDGTTYSGDYPYERMEWNFDRLVERLHDCLPGYPLGTSRFDALVDTVRRMDEFDSVAPLIQATIRM